MDNGKALLTAGSSQQMALAWVENSTTLYNSARDYILLQYYALAVIYYSAESDTQSDLQNWLKIGYKFCDWLSVGCNNNRTAITSIFLNNVPFFILKDPFRRRLDC